MEEGLVGLRWQLEVMRVRRRTVKDDRDGEEGEEGEENSGVDGDDGCGRWSKKSQSRSKNGLFCC